MSEQYYTARELADMKLPGVPTSKGNVLAMAVRESWPYRKRKGRGGGNEYPQSALPKKAQEEIERRRTAEMLKLIPAPALPDIKSKQTARPENSRQRLIADARAGVLKALEMVKQQYGINDTPAAEKLLVMARGGDEHLAAMLRLARDGRGRGSSDGLPSARSILRFVERAEAGDLTPVVPQKDMSIPAWAPLLLDYYQRPEKPSLEHAYRRFVQEWEAGGEGRITPSIYQVRGFVRKIGNVSRERGRMGPRELKNLQPFVRRDTSDMPPCECYMADGHTFDAEVQHPFHGNPFRPEVTTVVDIATRRVTGWSIGLAESSLAVMDAIRCAVLSAGIPSLFYCDNGSGYKNALMTDAGTGLMARLGTTMTHSEAYNSRARGIVERLHKTLWVTAAKELPGYMGRDMDREARLNFHKLSRKALKSKNKAVAMPMIAWNRFLEFCALQIDLYNNRPHRALPKCTDLNTGRKRHRSPNEQWQHFIDNGFKPMTVADDEARPLFRPQKLRVIRNGEINLYGNRYFSKALEEFHGEQLPIGYDVNDASKVWVYSDQGHFVCTAELNGNLTRFFGVSVAEMANEKRVARQEKRHSQKLEVIRAGRGQPAIEHVESLTIPAIGTFNFADGNHFVEVNEMVAAEPHPHPHPNLPLEGEGAYASGRGEQTPVGFADTPFEKGAGEMNEVESDPNNWRVPSGQHNGRARFALWRRLSALPEGVVTNETLRGWVKTYATNSECCGFLTVERMAEEAKEEAEAVPMLKVG